KLITSNYGGMIGQGTGATNFLAQLLGVSPGGVAGAANTVGTAANGIAEAGGAQAGYNNYLQNAGYAPAMRQLSKATVGQGASSGLLSSGATTRALQSRGAELNQSFFNNYLQQLAGLSGLGLQAGGLVANVGQRSTGGGPSTAGAIASTVGGLASIFSDRRLKRDIERVDEFSDGLGIYEFRYVTGIKRVLGVMADEVAKLRPWALGPTRAGFATVDYGAL
ncbi:MAG: hypothetical protein C0510_06890, partial [Erythrobacter sp.]|nr:hypothetical protein [Erythrobacter sp.]